VDFFLSEGPLRPSDAVAAIIALDDGRYLMQLRDQKPNLFYRGHWGLFGGAIELGENPEAALGRELVEEIGLKAAAFRYFTNFTFDYGRYGQVSRRFYEVRIASSVFEGLVLREGADMGHFEASEILNLPRVVPYDSFAIWLHASGALGA